MVANIFRDLSVKKDLKEARFLEQLLSGPELDSQKLYLENKSFAYLNKDKQEQQDVLN